MGLFIDRVALSFSSNIVFRLLQVWRSSNEEPQKNHEAPPILACVRAHMATMALPKGGTRKLPSPTRRRHRCPQFDRWPPCPPKTSESAAKTAIALKRVSIYEAYIYILPGTKNTESTMERCYHSGCGFWARRFPTCEAHQQRWCRVS